MFEGTFITEWDNGAAIWKRILTDNDVVEKVTQQLANIAEKYNFDKRAAVLKNVHPLSFQVHLESGVANGVLVVRTVQECSEVLYNLLTNKLNFTIEFNEKEKCTILREKVSQSAFRAVTEYEKLANSFWNFYLISEHRRKEKEPIVNEQPQSGGSV